MSKASRKELTNLLPVDGEVYYCEDLYSQESHKEDWFSHILEQSPPVPGKIRLFGKWIDEPRLSAWYGDKEAVYTYSNKKLNPQPWTPVLRRIKSLVERDCGVSFNSVLINYYRTGRDYMGFHQDNEKELGDQPIIASLSLGANRKFVFKYKLDRLFKTKYNFDNAGDIKSSKSSTSKVATKFIQKVELELKSGSLLIMKGSTQTFWQHALPKQLKVQEPRLNLTFRKILV